MRLFGNEQRRGFHYEMLAVPWAFLNGLFLGGWILRNGRKFWEGGPRD